jgi:hypothetical protein
MQRPQKRISRWNRWLTAAWFFLTPVAALGGVPFPGVPYKPDPPPAIDGQLDDWSAVPGATAITRREQAVYGAPAWRSPQDLSGKVWLAWRDDFLYLAADVTDDRLVQRGRGQALWKGDHVELYLDLAPDRDAQRNTFGAGQVHLGFSPGSLEKTGDPLADAPPEATVFAPEGTQAKGVQVAAQKTITGYTLEAAIPWPLLARLAGMPFRPVAGAALNYEIGLSDCDGPEPAQEKLMTVLAAPWRHARNRLVSAALAGADGKGSPPVRGLEVLKGVELQPKKQETVAFASLPVPPGKEAVLTLKARLATPRVAGYTRGMRLLLNGKPLDASRLVNWDREETRVDGRAMQAAAGDTFNVPYAPDFDSPNRHPSYALRSGPKLCRYELRVTDLVQPGQNALVIANAAAAEIQRALVVADVKLEVRSPATVRAKRPAPTGPLALIRPATHLKVSYAVVQRGPATLELSLGKERFRVESEFSTPKPAWVHGPNPYFDFRREVVERDEAILVRDTFINRTQENLPLMHRHRAFIAGLKKVCLAGLSPSGLEASLADPANPTSYGATASAGVGLLPVDDVMQVHSVLFSAPDHVGLADNQLVVRPGQSYTAEWALVPTARPAYYDMVNAVRRLRGVNFTLPGSFAFLRAHPRTMTHLWSDQQFVDFVRFKNAHFLCDGYGYATYKGRFPHGTPFQGLDYTVLRKQMERLRRIVPEARHQLYFHCFLDVLDEAPEKYRDARLLCADGSQATYGKPYERIFVPTEKNAFGRDIAGNVEMILGPPPKGFGCEGVYWDEFEYSRYQWHYADFSRPDAGLPWDGVSGDINPRTMQITRLKSAVELISQPFRLALARRILQGHDLVANGQPHTRTMAALHFPRFVETGSISNCAHTLLYSPIALGDHLTERSEIDAYRVMLRALDFGCVYYWYNDVTVIPTHPHLTSYMFPITPVELGEGYLIGRERIVTNRSGRYGWGDASAHEVHVFDDQGRERPEFKAPTLTIDRQTFTELRLPEDFSAAIMRK